MDQSKGIGGWDMGWHLMFSPSSPPQDGNSEIGAFSTSSPQIWVPFICDRDAVPAMSPKKEVFPSPKIEVNAFINWWRKLEIKGWRTLLPVESIKVSTVQDGDKLP